MTNLKQVIAEIKKDINPPKEEFALMQRKLKEVLIDLKKQVSSKKIDAQVFVGGSFAKGTIVKKQKYDADVFIRFGKEYDEVEFVEILNILVKDICKGKYEFLRVHGSRDYYQIKISEDFMIELIPVRKVAKPENAENITDLSYSHVNYMAKKLKTQKVIDEIKLAKAFCEAANCYGAESYISGFSGYSLELLISYYKSLEKLLKEIVKIEDKKVIDIERLYKNDKEVLMNLNSSKLHSPIILIDPTFKQRNALAALSKETFNRFKARAKLFLKNPDVKYFAKEKVDLEKLKASAIKSKKDFVQVEITTDKQEGDIAGSKLLKFYHHLLESFSKYYSIDKEGFSYSGKQTATFYLVGKAVKEIICNGPETADKENVAKFKKVHKNTFEKKGRLFARETFGKNLELFFNEWIKKNNDKIVAMNISKTRALQ